MARAVNAAAGSNRATGGGAILGESADVVIALLVLIDRWESGADLFEAVGKKLTTLETPGAHRASAL